MQVYRITFSNSQYSYSETVMLDDDCEATCMYIPGTWSGKEELKHVIGHLEGLDQSDDCPPVFRREPPTRVVVEDLTPNKEVPVMPKPIEDILL